MGNFKHHVPEEETNKQVWSLNTIIYSDATYYYICKAKAGTAAKTAKWTIKRILKVDPFTMTHPNGSDEFINRATTLATVQSYNYY